MNAFSNTSAAAEVWLVIGISGVTNSGKTTLAKRLAEHLSAPENATCLGARMRIRSVHALNQDEYFREIDDPAHIRVESVGHNNWELITALDMDRMCRDILEVLGPEFALYRTPAMDARMEENMFVEHWTAAAEQQAAGMLHANVLILEGFLVFNHLFTLDLSTVKFHMHVPYEKCFERRRLRKYNPPDVPGYFEAVVWPMYEKNFREYGMRSDVIFLNGDSDVDRIFQFVLDSVRQAL